MKIKATDQQVKLMAANAVNASKPMGLGILHYDPSDNFTPENFDIEHGRGLLLDYIDGRMVKFRAIKNHDHWVIPSGKADPEYQSWAHAYPTWESLAQSVGAEIIQS